MSPAVLLLLAFGAGLATGLARFGEPALLLAGWLAIAVLSGWQRRDHALWGLAAAAGFVAALAALSRESSTCAARLLPGLFQGRLRAIEPVFPDQTLSAVRLVGVECRGAVTARWPAGKVPAGQEGEAVGRWIPRPGPVGRAGGVLVIRAFETRTSSATLVDRFRNRLAERIRALFGARTAAVEALLVNRRGGMDPELRDRYARAGLVHILSISGFHVGVIVAWVTLLARLLTPRRHVVALAGVLVAVGYVVFLGWPAPAARAALLAGLVAQARWRQRHLAPFALMAATGILVLLLDPWAVFDTGAWLSLLALGGAAALVRWSDRRLGDGWGWRMLAASTGATVATAPVTAAVFGTVSLAGLALNFVAVPLAAIVVPGLLAALATGTVWGALGEALAASSGLLLGALDRLAWWGGGWEGTVVYQAVGLEAALPWLAVLAIVWWCIGDGAVPIVATRRFLLAGTVSIWILLGAEQGLAARAASGGLALHFLDVGQGDAALLRTPAGRWVLIDAGPRSERHDAGRRVVAPFLARQRARGIALAVVSHAHADHLGGMPAVFDRFPVGSVLEPAELVAEAPYLAWLDQLEAQGVPWRGARDGMSVELDSVRIRVLHPDPAWREWQMDLNEDSAILLVEYGAFRVLFAGDAGVLAEERLRGRVGAVSVLKVGHHGSRSATGETWLRELRPRVAVISSGAGNRYGHPHQEVTERLVRHGIGVWRTDQQGTITITTDGRRMQVAGRDHDASIPLAGEP